MTGAKCFRAGALVALALSAPAFAEPDLSGIWVSAQTMTALKDVAGLTPPLKPEPAATYRKQLSLAAAGDRSWDPAAICKPLGVSRALVEMGWPFELMQSPDRIDFLFQWNRLARAIAMAPKPATKDAEPAYMGRSNGRWDGETLVVDLDEQDGATFLDSSGLPHSDDMTVEERWQLTNGGQMLQARLHIVDPAFYTRPWDTILTFKRAPAGTTVAEDDCIKRTGTKVYYTLDNLPPGRR